MIPIVFITDKNFVMQTHIAIRSIIENKNIDTEYDIYIIMAECKKETRKEFDVLENTTVHINIVEASLEEFKGVNQIAHISVAALLKFRISDWIANYNKILYLDGDIYVRGDLAELYNNNIGDNYIAAVPDLASIVCNDIRINSGVMLINARKMREYTMADKFIQTRIALGQQRSMDQQTFNIVLAGGIKYLPIEYNCVAQKIMGNEKNLFSIDKLNALYNVDYKNHQDLVDNALIIHYATSAKPWKYTFVACGDEWYNCYKRSIYKNVDLRRDNRFCAHAKGFVKVLRNQGMKGVFDRVKDYTVNRNKPSSIQKKWG